MTVIAAHAQFARYVAVGGLSAALEYGLYTAFFLALGWAYLLANGIAQGLVFGANFALNRVWSFAAQGPWLPQMVRFALLVAVNMALTSWLLWLSVELVSADPLVAKAGIMVLMVLWNFWISRLFVYR